MISEIIFTDKAIKQVNQLVSTKEPGTYFRISVLGGGCSGFKYDFSFDKNIDQEDVKINNIVIDKVSLDILKGSEIDFVSELMGTSFKIFNPKTKSSCGCGISFSI
ncbi:MAG: iron-sulfur cluster assembly accessory protein [Candidatus Pelagibacter sp.]|jgi:iron-sulfur cluster assembly accessory protein|nr:iron-sulfur cluster assembly accessory protein [Candidatus Pelagibacter sp.]MDP6440346.1 iron-sulfur cluster assembly accessory protein [Pelagibacteraceae bacterium]|tara:strand:- start:3632 stop:3949 length:318 start_codon:yes stop_codon:yes gene_type:complete